MRNFKHIPLNAGLGNRINVILNHVHELESVRFYWTKSNALHCPVEALFEDIPILFCDKKHKNCLSKTCNKNYFYGMENKTKRALAKKFILKLKPSSLVKEKLIDNLDEIDAYCVRSLHPFSACCANLTIPNGVYLSTDSVKLRQTNPNTIQVTGAIGSERDSSIRRRKDMIDAVADWFNLLKCRSIYEAGIPYNGMVKPHSTFLDAARIVGKQIHQIKLQ